MRLRRKRVVFAHGHVGAWPLLAPWTLALRAGWSVDFAGNGPFPAAPPTTTDETQIAVVEKEEALQLHSRWQPCEAAVRAGLGIREELDRHAFSTYRPASSSA